MGKCKKILNITKAELTQLRENMAANWHPKLVIKTEINVAATENGAKKELAVNEIRERIQAGEG